MSAADKTCENSSTVFFKINSNAIIIFVFSNFAKLYSNKSWKTIFGPVP